MLIRSEENEFRLVPMSGPDFRAKVMIKIDIAGGLNSTYVSLGDHKGLVKCVLRCSRTDLRSNSRRAWTLEGFKQVMINEPLINDVELELLSKIIDVGLKTADILVERWGKALK